VSAGGQSVVVQLSDWCLCIVGGSERLIDLSASAFSRLAPLSAGLVWVEVTVP
jgi:rare lipoprotein A (peptidoglycan hydrolase)